MTSQENIEKLFGQVFSSGSKHIKSSTKHFSKMVERYQVREFGECLSRAGKFVEAVLKLLYVHTGHTLPPQREFKVAKVIKDLGNLEKAKYDASIRLVIPRACQFLYDIVSNRGGRHDPGEIDPNEMDATVTVSVCSWVLAEMVRMAQKGTSPEMAKAIVNGLMERKYPVLEEVEDRLYFHRRDLGARKTALVLLLQKYPSRVNKTILRSWLKRHKFSKQNITNAFNSISGVVDSDGDDSLLLLNPGIKEAETIISTL